jgi:hypothetical protein
MGNSKQQRAGLLQGTLDMLILRTLLYGPAHGTRSASTSSGPPMTSFKCSMALSILHCTVWSEEDGSSPKWETAPDRNREFKYYRLTDKGRKQLVVEESQWKQMAEAVARV